MMKSPTSVLIAQCILAAGVTLPLFSAFAAGLTQAEVKKILQIQEGVYKIFRGDEELCQGTSLDVAYEGDDKMVTLRAGQAFIWGNIGVAKFQESGGGDCMITEVNTLAKHRVKTVGTYKCKNPQENMVMTQEMVTDKNQIQINFERTETDKKKNQKFYCIFKK